MGAAVQVFGGMVPSIDDRLLPDTAASYSENAWLKSGALVGLPQLKTVHTLSDPAAVKVYRIPNEYERSTYLFDSDWLEFLDQDTDVIRAPVFDDTHDRYYWASSSLAPQYNTRARIANGDPPFLMGIPAPGNAPGVTVVGGSGTTVSRAYVYTWVTAYGEEGPPSPPTLVNGFVNGTWQLTWDAAAPDDIGVDRNLTDVRIYRTVTSSSGVATYFFVAEYPIATLSGNDTETDTDVSANDQLQSDEWTAPPSDLQGFTLMPNGIIASWRGNEVWFSEPYRPHAWPASYVLTVEYPIVGLGIIGQTLVVCTRGYPVSISGVSPAFMSQATLAAFEPCTGRGSILSTPEGVYYASPNGLVLVANGRAVNITERMISRDKWNEYTGEARLRAAMFGPAYMAYGSVVPGVFNMNAFDDGAFTQSDYTGAQNGFMADPFNERIAFGLLVSEDNVSNLFNDQWSGQVFFISGGEVGWLDQGDPTVPPQVTIWRSKIFQTQEMTNFGAFRIFFSVPPNTPTQNPVRNTDLEQELAADQYGLVRIYADDRLVVTRELRTSGEIMRIPSGFLADFWQFELETRVKILSIQFGTSVKDMRNV